MTEYIFVYGTLRKTFKNKYAQLLHNNAHFLGETFIQGRLYNLETYPVARYNKDDTEKIIGELYHIQNQEIIPLLDEYEEFGPQFPQPNEYIRIEITVTLKGKVYNTWFYQYNASTTHLQPIITGDYLQFLNQ